MIPFKRANIPNSHFLKYAAQRIYIRIDVNSLQFDNFRGLKLSFIGSMLNLAHSFRTQIMRMYKLGNFDHIGTRNIDTLRG